MERRFTAGPTQRLQDDLIVYLVPEEKTSLSRLQRQLEQRGMAGVAQAVRSGDFKGTLKQTSLHYPLGRNRNGRVLLAGLGKRSDLTPERMRRACAAAAKEARRLKVTSFTIVLSRKLQKPAESILAAFEGADLALYSYDAYKTPKSDTVRQGLYTIHSEDRKQLGIGSRAQRLADAIIAGTRFARDLSNAPGNEVYPETLADAAVKSADQNGYTAKVLNELDIEEAGMGGLMAVSRGSAHPPRFIILEHGPIAKKPIVLVGKGVTFDTGGISIKPSAGMAEMKMDMSGAAAVLGTFEAISRLGLQRHVIGLVPAVENMPDGNAQRPGDIVRHLSGKTSEVDNTDAEGRLILADALTYASRYNPAAVIDLATLTGAVLVALGHVAAGMMGNDDGVMDRLVASGQRTYERVWQLPLFEEYEKLIRSDVADMKNVGGRWAGTITAALFLKQHIGSYPWVHLDIAGTAMLEADGDYTQRGGSGFGVRLLTDFLRHWT